MLDILSNALLITATIMLLKGGSITYLLMHSECEYSEKEIDELLFSCFLFVSFGAILGLVCILIY